MKKLITLLCLLPLCASAQKNEISFNLGPSFVLYQGTVPYFEESLSTGLYISTHYSRSFGRVNVGVKTFLQQMRVPLDHGRELAEYVPSVVLFSNYRLVDLPDEQFYTGIHAGVKLTNGKGYCGGMQLAIPTSFWRKWA